MCAGRGERRGERRGETKEPLEMAGKDFGKIEKDFKWFYAYAIRTVTEELDARRVRLAGHILWAPSDDPLDS